jgi:hypothetical protein
VISRLEELADEFGVSREQRNGRSRRGGGNSASASPTLDQSRRCAMSGRAGFAAPRIPRSLWRLRTLPPGVTLDKQMRPGPLAEPDLYVGFAIAVAFATAAGSSFAA